MSWTAVARLAGIAALAVIALLGIAWGVAWALAGQATRHAERRLAERRAPPESLPPPRERQVMTREAQAAVVATLSGAGPLEPAPRDPLRRREDDVQQSLGWLHRQLAQPSATVDAPPDAVRALTEARRPALESLLATLDGVAGDAFAGAPPAELHGAADALLLDALVLQHDGRTAEATRRVEAAWTLADAWLEQAALRDRWRPARDLRHALMAARKVPVDLRRVPPLDVARLRARAARATASRADEILAVARDGDAADVLAEWRVAPTFTRRLFTPLYRRRLARSAERLAEVSDAIVAGSSETVEERIARRTDVTRPPLEHAPGALRELALGTGHADLVEPRWDVGAFEESEASRDLDAIEAEWERTQRALGGR